MILPIVTYPNQVLVTQSEEVTDFDSSLRELIRDMLETMIHSGGIGLAANQVNVLKKIIVIYIPYMQGKKEFWHNKVHVLINPEITYKSEELINYKEGCLSFPDLEVDTNRHKNIEIKAQEENGNYITLKANDLFSICLQHEIDHLNGIVFTNRKQKEL